MGTVTYRDAVAIFKLVYYSPALFGAIVVSARHGFLKSSGWVFLVIFCVIRIVGASAQLATISNPTNKTAITIALITSVLGLSPLLMCTLGILSRAFYPMLKLPKSLIFQLVVVKAIHIPAVVALVLCIVGATSAATPAQIESESSVHVGIILYLVVFFLLVVLELIAWICQRRNGKGEGLLILAVGAALPLIFVRLLYAAISTFAHSKTFNVVSGSQTVSLFMEVLEEMATVVIFIAAGLKLPSVPEDSGSRSGVETMAYRTGRGDFGIGKLGLLSIVFAAISALTIQPQKQQADQNENSKREVNYRAKQSHRGRRMEKARRSTIST